MPTPCPQKDQTKYKFNGSIYNKCRLVHAVVSAYVAQKPDITINELTVAFPKYLQGSWEVVIDEKKAMNKYTDYSKRYFAQYNEILRLKSGNALVCTQWGIFNINDFIARAKNLGFKIEEV